jgi:putative transposon-encoded protein
VATILDTYMTLIKKKITEVESIVNKADNRKTAGKIYLPKDWIGKKVKTVLLSSLILIAVVVITEQQQAKAELTLRKLFMLII